MTGSWLAVMLESRFAVMPDSWFALMSESQLGPLDGSSRHSLASQLLASWLTETVSLPVAISRFGIKSLKKRDRASLALCLIYISENDVYDIYTCIKYTNSLRLFDMTTMLPFK